MQHDSLDFESVSNDTQKSVFFFFKHHLMESALVYDHKQPALTQMFMLCHTENGDCLSCVVCFEAKGLISG